MRLAALFVNIYVIVASETLTVLPQVHTVSQRPVCVHPLSMGG